MKRNHLVLLLCVLAGAVILAGAGIAIRKCDFSRRAVYTDGDSIRLAAGDAKIRSILWQPPKTLPDSINTREDEYEPRVTRDGLTLFFVRGRAGANADIWTCSRTDPQSNAWSEPRCLSEINTDADELGPLISPDGSRLYFCSNREGSLGGYDLWMAVRDSAAWSAPVNLGPSVNSAFDENHPAIAPDGTNLYFSSDRPRPGSDQEAAKARWPTTPRQDITPRDQDLYVAAVSGDDVTPARYLHEVSSLRQDGTPEVSPVGDFLYFASDRAGGSGGLDIYRSRILRGELQTPENLGPEVNTPANELDPALSMAGFQLCFSSNRALDQGSDYNLYTTQSREVFRDVESREPLIDLASLWSGLVPWLLWLLLLALALLCLLAMVRGVRSRRLSLLARCLLVSLIAHALIMILLTFWQVTTGLAQVVRGEGGGSGGPVQVAVAEGSATSDGLYEQVRGGATDAQPAMNQLTASRMELLPMRTNEPSMREEIQIASAEQERQPIARTEAASDAMPSPASPPIELLSPPLETRAFAASINLPSNETVEPAAEVSIALRIDQSTSPRSHRIDNPRLSDPATIVSLPPLAETTLEDRSSANLPAVDSNRIAEAVIPVFGSNLAQAPKTEIAPAAGAIDVVFPNDRAAAVSFGSEPVISVSAASTSAPRREPVICSAPAGTSQAADLPGIKSNDPVGSITSAVAATTGDAPFSGHSRQPLKSATDSLTPAIAGSGPDVALPGETVDARLSQGEASGDPTPRIGAPSSSARAAASSVPGAGDTTRFDAQPSFGSTEGLAPSRTAVGRSEDAPPGADRLTSAMTDAAGRIPSIPRGETPISLPSEVTPPEDQYAQRAPETRTEIVRRMGGSEATEQAVSLALEWLARHQGEDGRWSARHFDDHCGHCAQPGKYDTDIACTGLALLCFLGADHTHVKDGPYRDNVSHGLEWLLKQQKADGDLRGNETMYSHGIAAIVISEAFGMTHDAALVEPVQKAVAFIAGAANTDIGGWRYEPGQMGDTSVLGWQMMALISARRSGIQVPDRVIEVGRRWLAVVNPQNRPGQYSYQPGQRPTAAMTAEGMFVMQLLGAGHDDPAMKSSADYVLSNTPRWSNEPNTYYWYYATLAMFQHQGESWRRWNEAMTRELLANQRKRAEQAGSWDPVDGWSKIGGRVYQTAICTLMLEVYYRYLPMYAAQVVSNPPAENTP